MTSVLLIVASCGSTGVPGGVATDAPSFRPQSPAASVGPSLGPVELEAAQLAVVEAVNGDPLNFGFPYLDDHGVLVIPYVGENAGRAAVEQRLTPDVRVRWEQVPYSQSELQRVALEIRDLHLEDVWEISAGTNRNRVIVKVSQLGSVSDVSELLAARYGGIVLVEFDPDIAVTLPYLQSSSP